MNQTQRRIVGIYAAIITITAALTVIASDNIRPWMSIAWAVIAAGIIINASQWRRIGKDGR